MEIVVNGESIAAAPGSTVAALLTQLGMGRQGRVAVELNREVLPRGQYQATTLQSGDRLEIVQAIGGG